MGKINNVGKLIKEEDKRVQHQKSSKNPLKCVERTKRKRKKKKKTQTLSLFVAMFFKLETQPYIEKQLYTFGMLQLQTFSDPHTSGKESLNLKFDPSLQEQIFHLL